MGKAEYQFAKRARGDTPTRPVELAQVASVSPLAIKIGDATYSSADWTMYEPWFEDQDGTFSKPGKWVSGVHSGAGVDCVVGGISTMSYSEDSWQRGEYQERKAFIKYNVGDLLAVQEMAGGRSFIILGKLREVV